MEDHGVVGPLTNQVRRIAEGGQPGVPPQDVRDGNNFTDYELREWFRRLMLDRANHRKKIGYLESPSMRTCSGEF